MQILISAVITLIILAITLPLFYIFIVSHIREKLEDEAIKNVKSELEALVREFNHSALSNISLLENLTIRAKRILKEIENREEMRQKSKKKSKTDIERNISYSQEKSVRQLSSLSYTVDEEMEKTLKTDNIQNAIVNMYQIGMDNVSIARKLNKSVSEIDMILSLNLIENVRENTADNTEENYNK